MSSKYNVPLILVEESDIYDDPEDSQSDRSHLSKIHYLCSKLAAREFSVLLAVERKIAHFLKLDTVYEDERKKQTQKIDVSEEIQSVDESEIIRFKSKKVGDITYDFPDPIIQEIQQKADVVVLLGFNRILRGDILSAAPYGVLSFHGADIRRYRGRPGRFFQWINGEEEIGLTLQRLNNELDGGEIILCKHANVADVQSLQAIKPRLLSLYGDLLVQGLHRIEDPEFEPETPNLGILTYSEEGDNLMNVVQALKRNIKRRYF
jgi:methionyl-tRNA formyltransferase